MAGERLAETARVNVKLVPGTALERAERLLRESPGVLGVEQLFPGETDEEMRGMYMVEVDGRSAGDAVRQLAQKPEVEYAQETARRKLIW
ncbi:MAG TPA: hypothetical protein VF541_21050 [Longimicrobium sp.]|jgi:hypothetical protein